MLTQNKQIMPSLSFERYFVLFPCTSKFQNLYFCPSSVDHPHQDDNEKTCDDLLVGRRLFLHLRVGLFHIFDPPAQLCRNSHLSFRQTLLEFSHSDQLQDISHTQGKKGQRRGKFVWLDIFLFLDERRRRGGGVLPPSNSLWSSFPVGDVTTCSAWDTTWSYSLHSDALCLSKTLSYSVVVSYKDSVSHLKW